MKHFSKIFHAHSKSLRVFFTQYVFAKILYPKLKQSHHKFASGYLAMTLALAFFSCSQKQEEQKPSMLSDFWKKEIARLNKEKPMITKISTVNGKTDTLRTDSIDWEKELQIFVKNDLYEKDLALYDVDTVKKNDSMQVDDGDGGLVYRLIPAEKITFTAKREDLKIGKMIFGRDGSIYSVDIIIKAEEQLYGINKRMIYSTHGRYEITGSQDVKFLNGINYKVQVKF